jgi:hypothetical protein
LRPDDVQHVGAIASAAIEVVQSRAAVSGRDEGCVFAWNEDSSTLCLGLALGNDEQLVVRVDPSGAVDVEGPTQSLNFGSP